MYIKTIHDINVGPIEDASIFFNFTTEGNPKPVVLVGENGSGKSVFLSNIVDSFYEIAGKVYSDARPHANTEGYQYYKTISPTEIHLGQKYLLSHITFTAPECHNEKIEYIFKSGNLSMAEFKQKLGTDFNYAISLKDDENFKDAYINKESVELVLSKDIQCYFGPDRYEKPCWMGAKYYSNSTTSLSDYEHPAVHQKWTGQIDNPIKAQNTTAETLQWLLDIIADSRLDIAMKKKDGEMDFELARINKSYLLISETARLNVEMIMSKILGTDVYFNLGLRSMSANRFSICDSNNNVLVPSLDALSTGQIALFNMFATIVRYADKKNVNSSMLITNISGIVVIDEIELHLHTNLQREVLPNLIKLFPKVQFVITTHSPLFLLGMDEVFGADGYDAYQMPNASKITTEGFSEFQKAYNYLTQTQTYHNAIIEAIQGKLEKNLIVTEGATDWKHLKAAFSKMLENEEFRTKYGDMDFEYLEYEPDNSDVISNIKLQMGNKQLEAMCKYYSHIKQSRKIIFIADADDDSTNRVMGAVGSIYKNWGNNVYSFIIPVPPHRKDTPKVCIENYYTDKDLKTPVTINGIERRIFMGDEFDTDGISRDRDNQYICLDRNNCGIGKIKIIDGATDKRVFKINDQEKTNVALPKMAFANCILKHDPSFANIDFSNFELIFDIIRKILDEPNVA
jgi:hypothetical protein